jgi:hypothetical protein
VGRAGTTGARLFDREWIGDPRVGRGAPARTSADLAVRVSRAGDGIERSGVGGSAIAI